MRVSEAISKARALKPSLYDDDILTGFLQELDGKITLEVLGVDAPPPPPPPHDTLTIVEEDGTETEAEDDTPEDDPSLLIPSPFDDIYPLYLVAMIDFHNRDTDSYTNDMALFNAAFAEWRAYHRRTTTPKGAGGWRGF